MSKSRVRVWGVLHPQRQVYNLNELYVAKEGVCWFMCVVGRPQLQSKDQVYVVMFQCAGHTLATSYLAFSLLWAVDCLCWPSRNLGSSN